MEHQETSTQTLTRKWHKKMLKDTLLAVLIVCICCIVAGAVLATIGVGIFRLLTNSN